MLKNLEFFRIVENFIWQGFEPFSLLLTFGQEMAIRFRLSRFCEDYSAIAFLNWHDCIVFFL